MNRDVYKPSFLSMGIEDGMQSRPRSGDDVSAESSEGAAFAVADALESKKPVSRRTALMGGLRMLKGVMQRDPTDVAEAARALKEGRPLSKEATEYLKTFLISQLFLVGQMAFKQVASKLTSVRLGGNALKGDGEQFMQELKQHPIETYLNVTVLGPALETFIFQVIPSAAVDRRYGEGDMVPDKRKLHIKEGAQCAALFALLHNVLGLDFRGIPLNQFMGGLFFWYINRSKGDTLSGASHTFFAHMSINASALFSTQNPGVREVYEKLSTLPLSR